MICCHNFQNADMDVRELTGGFWHNDQVVALRLELGSAPVLRTNEAPNDGFPALGYNVSAAITFKTLTWMLRKLTGGFWHNDQVVALLLELGSASVLGRMRRQTMGFPRSGITFFEVSQMIPQQMTLDTTQASRFFQEICLQGDCLHLRPQQRVPPPLADKVIVLREGMLAIDAMPAKGKLQVLDFLGAGDVVSASTVLPTPGFRYGRSPAHRWSLWTLLSLMEQCRFMIIGRFLIAQCLNQLARVNIHHDDWSS